MKRPAVEEFKRLSVPENGPWGMADSDTVDLCDWILHLEATLKKVDELYSHAWDRADGGLSMFGSSVPKFEATHKAVHEALGIKLLETEDEE